MGNHSDTGELLEDVFKVSATGLGQDNPATVVDQSGYSIKLDQSIDENQRIAKSANPAKLKDSSGRVIDLMSAEEFTGMLTPKEVEAKLKKKKSS